MSQKPFSRTVQDMGNGCRGVSLPAEMVDRYDVDLQDELPYEVDVQDGAVTFYFDG